MKRLGMILFVLVWGGVIVPSGAQAQQGQELIRNGAFAQGLEGWTIDQPCASCWMEVQPGELPGESILAWERTNSVGEGSAIWARQPVNIDVREYTRLLLSVDVRVDAHNLPNSGWWSEQNNGSGEYPVKIMLLFTDARGAPLEWSFGFLATHDGSTQIQNYMLLPAGEWSALQTDVLSPRQWVDPRGSPLPAPAMLTEVLVGGGGWDFAGAVTNLSLVGEFEATGSGSGSDQSGGSTETGFIVEEYPLVSSTEDTPDHFEFRDRVTQNILAHRQPWREPDPMIRIAATNATIAKWGYSLVAQGEGYALLHGGSVLVPDVSHVWPLAANASGTDFRLLIDSMSQPTLVVIPDTVGLMGSQFIYIAPVYVGDDLYEVEITPDASAFVLKRNGAVVYTVTPSGPWVEPPVKALWAWGDQWVLEAEGDVLVDGESLRAQLGYDELFDWRLIAGQPFFFFRQGEQIGLSYAGMVLPYTYEQVQHGLCCEAAMFNPVGNESMVWFYALRGGTWFYVEGGMYGE
jgi:hypothetical protein